MIANTAAPIVYRSDIDGLRAVAVLSVLFAHAGVPWIAGGFLGVDVFFVISGYLITSILKKDLEAGKYSLARFYERRAWRILPALIPVLLVSVPFAVWLMLPDFLQNFGQSTVATILFSNNLLLALTSGYWDLESSYKPLLHTWSLGVEEQFYVAYPLLLAAVWGRGRRVQITLIAGLGLASFVFSEIGWRSFPEANFYLPVSRAWELMVGCGAAYFQRRETRADGAVSLLSLAAVLASMAVFDEHTPSPSVFSAIPVLGTAGVILFSRPGHLAYRLLSLKPVVFIGLISYSLYLWHQPLFAFARIASFEPPPPWQMAALSVLTIVLAAATWRWVEEPFRRPARMPLRAFIPAVGLPLAGLLAVGLVLHFKQGFPQLTFPNLTRAGDVYISYNERIRAYSRDEFPRNGRPNVVVIGDSFGRDVANILLEARALDGKNLIYAEGWDKCDGQERTPPGEPSLYRAADIVVVALHKHDGRCVRAMDRALFAAGARQVVYLGTKGFGYNINPFGRVPMPERPSAYARIMPEDVMFNRSARAAIGADRYVDLIALLGPDGERSRFFDGAGNPLTPDARHLTLYGTRFVAERLRRENPLAFRAIEAAGAPAGEQR